MQKIGVTGCIGSGKTMVCKIFEELGIPVYNADERAKHLMTNNLQIISKVKALFGNESYNLNGELNRPHIASLAFNNKMLLDELNKTVHPTVFADFDQWVFAHKNYAYIIKEAALMFETDSYKGLDKFIVVTAPLPLRIIRTIQRDKISEEQVMLRMNNQMSQEEKLTKANFEIMNDEQHSLIAQVVALHQQFIKKI